jgi:hypothetical protein
MPSNKKESLLVASGVFILTTGGAETLRWFGYIQNITPLARTAFAAVLGLAAFSLVYRLRAGNGSEKKN